MVHIEVDYVLGALFIAANEHGIDRVTIADVHKACQGIQKKLNDNDINAIVLDSSNNMYKATQETECFEFMSPDFVQLRKGVHIDKVKHKFLGYLPIDVLLCIQTVSKAVIEG